MKNSVYESRWLLLPLPILVLSMLVIGTAAS
ncbi:hypothetical protein GGR23_003099 [Gellertiella hungarica]|uniref:Uncharacterized protein n=1 Tax=Gellertiella hungarica TaxID=1572859 RepID=A0A7W6J6V2_9HYPH|nr:hypothetical protein [Gellertiella hungarica]